MAGFLVFCFVLLNFYRDIEKDQDINDVYREAGVKEYVDNLVLLQ